MVQSVEGLRSELQLLGLGEEEALVESDIEIIDTWLTNTSASPNTVRERAGLSEASLVEVRRMALREACRGITDLLREKSLVGARVSTVGLSDTHRQP